MTSQSQRVCPEYGKIREVNSTETDGDTMDRSKGEWERRYSVGGLDVCECSSSQLERAPCQWCRDLEET